MKLPGISSVGGQKRTLSRFAGSRSAPPGGATKTSSQHAVRRHMQNEYKKDVLSSNALNGAKPEDVKSWYVKVKCIRYQTSLCGTLISFKKRAPLYHTILSIHREYTILLNRKRVIKE